MSDSVNSMNSSRVRSMFDEMVFELFLSKTLDRMEKKILSNRPINKIPGKEHQYILLICRCRHGIVKSEL